MNLDPKQTEAFRCVIRTGSFEQAALRLHLTPPAISQRVRALESALGSALVVRSRPCRPTETGQRLLQYLKRATLLEADLLAELAERSDAPLVVVAALNADSLGTWFFPALAEVLIRERVLLDLTVEDQDHTYSLLETGLAIGCISTEPKPMRGCTASPLGSMRYRLVASAGFRQQHFANGLTRNAARKAPVVAYTRKDTLQSSFLLRRLGLPEGAIPATTCPVPSRTSVRSAMGWAMAWCPSCCCTMPCARARWSIWRRTNRWTSRCTGTPGRCSRRAWSIFRDRSSRRRRRFSAGRRLG
ncbi:chromosome replication initiation inhibitor protein [Pseudomonas sp. BAY1663]|uniref:HTH-type transcriptional regulator ArgP n=1 Tax=Pseudomonas sp. BAY1663 TaxID=1439940 RepID=UPI00042DE4CB|nr:HTH-type transcriptional regulator ArgP [Pseudomonas sp. BAY1663]EXF44468.1 chromosome replication initiation inhibitor protein [Pseudomonas sp. BAY1663]